MKHEVKDMIKSKYLQLALLLFVFLFPYVNSSKYVLHIAIMAGVFVVLALSFDLLFGHVGLLSLGHPAFWGIGAYASAILSVRIGLPFWVCFVSGGAIAAIFAYLFSHAALRLSSHSFVIVTLGLNIIVYQICLNWIGLTGGFDGIWGIPRPAIGIPWLFNIEISTSTSYFYYYFILVLALFTLFFLHRLEHSHIGRAFLAIREDQVLAETLGVDTVKHKKIAFVTASFFAGLAGSFFAHYVTLVDPSMFSLYYSTVLLIMVIIGGRGILGGVVLGAALFTIVPEVLRVTPELREVCFGITLIAVIRYCPGGLADVWNKFRARARRR